MMASDGPDSAYDIATDVLEGVAAIADYIGKSQRKVFYLAECGQLPVFRLGRKIHMRKSAYRRHIEELEAAALKTRERSA